MKPFAFALLVWLGVAACGVFADSAVPAACGEWNCPPPAFGCLRGGCYALEMGERAPRELGDGGDE